MPAGTRSAETNGVHAVGARQDAVTVRITSLLAREEPPAWDGLRQVLSEDFQARCVGRRYFPISILREIVRRYLNDSQLRHVDRLAFYQCASDAILDAMASCGIARAANVARALSGIVRSDDCDSTQALLIRLHYVAGLNWTEIDELMKSRGVAIDAERSAATTSAELDARGISQDLLQEQNLRPRGPVTQLLEDVREGKRPLGDVVVNERAKLRRQAEHLLRLEGGNISLQADDLVNEMYLRMPKAAEKSPINHLEFDALARRIMRHILIDRARKPIPSQGKFSSELPEHLSVAPNVEEHLLKERALQVVGEVLSEIGKTDRETAAMVRTALFSNADQKEIAALHAVSVSTVKRRIKQVRERVRKRLGLG